MGNECWNSVHVYGARAEIERFRRTCIDLPAGSDPLRPWDGWNGCEATIGHKGSPVSGREGGYRRRSVEYVWNYRERRPEPGSWFFAFDTPVAFPDDLLEELASSFPKLAFDCECIDSDDDFMGFGWFNAPPGGEAFSQGMAVPKNYWTERFHKRGRRAHARHLTRIEALIRAARRADGAELD